MKRIKVPIFTEEYFIIVIIGSLEELKKAVKGKVDAKYLDNKRGICLDTLRNGEPPLILINGDYEYSHCISTIAHEASHAMDDIEDYLNIKDINGEFHAHGISSVLRHTLKYIKIWEKLNWQC